jgi:DNA-binding winged helix-turn-helix (wHTH) protein
MTKRHIYTFGAFQLDPQQKILLRDGERIPLCPKTFATLLALIESGGAVISKDELLEKVWPDTFIEESNLTKNISLLRKALSNGHDHSAYIETIPTIGYRFVGPVRRLENGDAVRGRNGEAAREMRATARPVGEENLPLSPYPVAPPSLRYLWLWGSLAWLLIVGVSWAW